MNKFRSDWGKWMPEGYVQDFSTCSILAESQDEGQIIGNNY